MERERKNGKKRGETWEKDVLFPSLPSFFPALSLVFRSRFIFARASLSKRLEQATARLENGGQRFKRLKPDQELSLTVDINQLITFREAEF